MNPKTQGAQTKNNQNTRFVPIASKFDPQIQGTEGNNKQSPDMKTDRERHSNFLSQHHRLLPSVTSMSVLEGGGKSKISCLKGSVHESISPKPRLPAVNQLPLKRLSPDSVKEDEDDDDFQ